MGAGASSGIAAGVTAASTDDLKTSLAALPPEAREKLLSALMEEEEEEPDPGPAPLSEGRKAKVEGLFKTFEADGSSYILLSSVESLTVKLGPHDSTILADLSVMDADKDGKLTLVEMISYFTKVSAVLNDEEFNMTIEDMIAAKSA